MVDDDYPLTEAAKAIPQEAVDAVLEATGRGREDALENWAMFHDHGISYAEWMVRVALAAYDAMSRNQRGENP